MVGHKLPKGNGIVLGKLMIENPNWLSHKQSLDRTASLYTILSYT